MSNSRSISSSDYLKYLHEHDLIKNDDYVAREGDLCGGCGLLLCKSSAVYQCTYFGTSAKEDDCAHFFLHQSCAHLPWRIKHPSHQNHSLYLITQPGNSTSTCYYCGIKLKWFFYRCYDCEFQICLACVIPLKKFNIYPPYHGHKLTLSTRLASFECDACQKVDTDFSYMCYTCPFWIHLGCSNLPTSLECETRHKHPLRLAYSLPENYRTFQQPCKICTEQVYPAHWLYYCPNCRFFAHIKCATSPPTLRINQFDFDETNFVHLPLPEHESLLQNCIKETSFRSEDACTTPPDHFYHWSHEHQIVLKNTSVLSSTYNEEGILPICNGCTESISINDTVFYECSECGYILHKYCALLPKEMQLDLGGKHIGIQPSIQDIWSCTLCECSRNGTQFRSTYETNVKLDSGCAVLPKRIKHEAHSHLLEQWVCVDNLTYDKCLACNKSTLACKALFKCINEEGCYYCLHTKCALKPRTVTHRWDPHPLYLIFSAEDVIDHPHEFQCELCSEEIDTNYWFYHCSVCDLSFHFNECIDLFLRYSKVKFGATNIKIEAHQHCLTFVLNKKKGQPCVKCHSDTYNKPVLACTPCKFIQHAHPDLCSGVKLCSD